MNKDSIKKITYAIIGILVLIVIVYLVSPLFISTEINEPLPKIIKPTVTFEEFSKMSEDERIEIAKNMTNEQENQMLVQYAELWNNTRLDEDMNINTLGTSNPSTETATLVGVNDGIHNAEGQAKIIPISNDDSILRFENLKVTNGPDLYVYLSTDKAASEFVSLGKLKLITEIKITIYLLILIYQNIIRF